MKNNVEGFIYMLIYLMSLDTEEERIKFVKIYDTYRNRMHYTANRKSVNKGRSGCISKHVDQRLKVSI